MTADFGLAVEPLNAALADLEPSRLFIFVDCYSAC